VLQQKEHYSPYVFEDKAAELLAQNTKLKADFELVKSKIRDDGKEMTAAEQLEWIYKHSSHYEKEHNRLPVFKVLSL